MKNNKINWQAISSTNDDWKFISKDGKQFKISHYKTNSFGLDIDSVCVGYFKTFKRAENVVKLILKG
ncbi:MAG: hypothetical protein Q7R95_01895 [bacterium]|nr:hypothetical protein [bacterium]